MGPMRVAALCIFGLLLQSCSWVVATESVKGRAFVTKQVMYASTYWNCDATKGEPTCYEVNKLGQDEGHLAPQASAGPDPAPAPTAVPEESVQPAAEEKPAKTPPKKKGKK